jgi:hypothetical protein
MSYTPPTREDIYGALFALISTGEGLAGTISWGDPSAPQGLLYTSRRVKLWDDLPAQPAVCQAEHDETYQQATRMPFKRKFTASWILYHKAGAVSPGSVPTITSNQMLDAVEALFSPTPDDPGFPDERLTLGGLVHHCWIDGKVFKDPGDIDGQGLVIVPITMLVP